MDANEFLTYENSTDEVVEELQVESENQFNDEVTPSAILSAEDRLRLKNPKRTVEEVPEPEFIYWDCILNTHTGKYEWHRITRYPSEIDMSEYAKPAFAFSAH